MAESVLFPLCPPRESCVLKSGRLRSSSGHTQPTQGSTSVSCLQLPGPRVLPSRGIEGRTGKTTWINNYIKFSLYRLGPESKGETQFNNTFPEEENVLFGYIYVPSNCNSRVCHPLLSAHY